MKNFKNSNLLQENNLGNEIKSINEMKEKFSALFLGINYDLITGEELISLGEEIKKAGNFFQITHGFVYLSDTFKSLIGDIIFNDINGNIPLPQKGKDFKDFIFTQDYIELGQVQILLQDLVNDLWFVDGDGIGYIGKRIEDVGEKLIEIGKGLK